MTPLARRLWKWLAARLTAKPCERCGGPGCCVFVYAAVRIAEGPGGTSIGMRVNHRTPPPEWLCRGCVGPAMADHRGRVRDYNSNPLAGTAVPTGTPDGAA
jgi:hypothetical protein